MVCVQSGTEDTYGDLLVAFMVCNLGGALRAEKEDHVIPSAVVAGVLSPCQGAGPAHALGDPR